MLLILLLASLGSQAFRIPIALALPVEWIVDDDGPADFRSVQSAINAAQPNDVISVQNGIYYERLKVNKSVSLFGVNQDSVIIDGENRGTVVLISADDVSVRGFTLTNGTNGTSVIGVNNCTIESNIVKNNNDRGILISRSQDSIVRDNIVLGSRSGYGINANASKGIIIEDNSATDNFWDGIGLLNSTDCIIRGNTINNNQVFGIWIDFSHDNIIYQNNLFNNTFQVSSNTPSNLWNNGLVGNYWADYQGMDEMSGTYQNESGSDGIGDEPYIVDEGTGQQDNYPLWLPHINANYLYTDTEPPFASITYSQGILHENQTVDFFSSGSHDSAGNHTITSYHWSFGDGTIVLGPTANHRYIGPGNYTVTLTLTDIAGNQAYTTVIVNIQSQQEEDFSPLIIIGIISVIGVAGAIILWRRRLSDHS
jgi:parallel beta-helix repeat protein